MTLATAPTSCNRCRCPLAVGAEVFVGPVTKQTWCLACAEQLGYTSADHEPAESDAMSAIGERLRAMGVQEAVAAMKANARTVGSE